MLLLSCTDVKTSKLSPPQHGSLLPVLLHIRILIQQGKEYFLADAKSSSVVDRITRVCKHALYFQNELKVPYCRVLRELQHERLVCFIVFTSRRVLVEDLDSSRCDQKHFIEVLSLPYNVLPSDEISQIEISQEISFEPFLSTVSLIQV